VPRVKENWTQEKAEGEPTLSAKSAARMGHPQEVHSRRFTVSGRRNPRPTLKNRGWGTLGKKSLQLTVFSSQSRRRETREREVEEKKPRSTGPSKLRVSSSAHDDSWGAMSVCGVMGVTGRRDPGHGPTCSRTGIDVQIGGGVDRVPGQHPWGTRGRDTSRGKRPWQTVQSRRRRAS